MTISLKSFDYRSITTKQLPDTLIESDDLREQLRLGDCQCADNSQLRRSLQSAIRLVEQETGYVIGPRVVEVEFDQWPCSNTRAGRTDIPLPRCPVWSADDLAIYLATVEDCGTKVETLFAAALDAEFPLADDLSRASIVISYFDSQGGVAKTMPANAYFLDRVRRPQRIRAVGCCGWPCHDPCRPINIKFVCGFKDVCEVEIENPLIFEAIVLATLQLYDEPNGFDEIIKANAPLWDMIGF